MNATSAEYLDALRAGCDFLRDVCRYEYLHGDDEALRNERASESDTILFTRLERHLRALNPDLSESALRRAGHALHLPAQTHPIATQQQLHAILFQQTPPPAVRYFDFTQITRNSFLIVENFRVLGASVRQTVDLAVFVNGIPLALLAFGDSNSKAGTQRAVQRLRHLQTPHAIPQLLCIPQILLAVQKNFTSAGMAGAHEHEFQPWDDPFPFTWDELRAALRQIPRRESELPAAQDVALAGLLSPKVLLELLQNFTLFETGGIAPNAKLARVHQYQAVRRACAQLLTPMNAEPGGLIWHPGNSGKAHTLAWLVGQLRKLPAFASQGIVLLTSCARQRELLCLLCAQHGLEAPREILEPGQLAPSLRRSAGRVFVLAPKIFQETFRATPSTPRPSSLYANPLLLLIDEAQRDEDGTLLSELRQAFPNAAVISLTAHSPARTFSAPMIHFITPVQALHRGYLLPVKTEARLPRLHHLIETNPRAASGTMATRLTHTDALTAPLVAQRIESIAEDLHEHFKQEIRRNHGKGLVLAANAKEAALYFHALEQNLSGQIGIILPKPQQHEKTDTALYRRFAQTEELVQRWRDAEDELALLVLAGPLTRDFAAPALQVVYVDRPLWSYALLQSLALVQTPGPEDKQYGLLVDYYGVMQSLPHELAQFEHELSEEVLAPRFSENTFEELHRLRRELRSLFKSYPDAEDVESWLFSLEAPELRRVFQNLWQDFVRLLDQLLPRMQEDFKFMQDVLWLDHVRQQATSFYFDEALQRVQGSKKVRRTLETMAHEQGLMRVREMARVSDESFLQEIASLNSLQAQVLRLQYALSEEIRQNAERDPAFYQVVQQRVTRVVLARRQKQMDDMTALQHLREEALRLRTGTHALNQDTQLSPDAQAYWHVLVRYLAPPHGAQGRYEELAVRLLDTLEPDTHIVDWTIKEDWQREMRRKIKHLLREFDCPQDLLDPLTQALMQLTRARFGAGE